MEEGEIKSEIVIEEFKSEMTLEERNDMDVKEDKQLDMFLTFNPQLPEEFSKLDDDHDAEDPCMPDIPVHVQIKEESQDLLDENLEDAFIDQDIKPDITKIVILPSEGMVPLALPVIQTIRNYKQWEMGSPPFECEHCSLTFSEYRVFRDHVMESHGQDPIVACDICNVPCGSNSEFVKHREKNHNEEMCLVCKKMIIAPKMTFHLKTVHNLSGRPTIEDSVLEAHHQQPSATGKGPDPGSRLNVAVEERIKKPKLMKCNVCQREFINRKIYQIHLERAISGKKCEPSRSSPSLNLCPVCSDQFIDKPSLTGHIRSHKTDSADDTDFLRCQECKRGYRNSNRMVEHRILIHGFRPVKCELSCGTCEKEFSSYKMLIRHEVSCKGKSH